ncbi:hypothetical protein BH11ARM2_BH11ARM2_03980 [soil metagenome]
MSLRAVFYGSIILGIVLMLGWPWILGHAPHVPLRDPAQKAYATRTVLYLGALLVDFLACFASAVFLVRNTRLEAAALARENLRKLTEGAMNDLRRAREKEEE